MLKNPHKKDVLVCLRLIYNLYNHGKDLCFASSGFGSSAQSVCSIQSCIYLCIERKKKKTYVEIRWSSILRVCLDIG